MESKNKEKKENKKITFKNYLIISIICILTIGLTIYLCNCYKVYNNSKLEIPVLRETLSEITIDELDHYVTENQNVTIYMCIANDINCRNYEKKLKKFINAKNLQDSIVYLDLKGVNAEQFIDDFNKKYASKPRLTTSYPTFVYFEEAQVSSVLQAKNGELTIEKTKQFIELNEIGD